MYFKMLKILGFTSIRSDYDLLYPLYKLLDEDDGVEFKLAVSGAHLSPSFGDTLVEIEKDGFDILIKIETLLSSDSSVSRLKGASILLQSLSDVVAGYSPDLLIYAGDREDVLMYSLLGGFLNIPTIHAYSGDHASDGYIDNPVRHATSKLSTVHFVTLEQHKQRLLNMGEASERIHVVGNISLDRFIDYLPMKKSELRDLFGLSDEWKEFALVIFHPVTEEIPFVSEYFKNILKSLENKGVKAFVSYPNVDPGNNQLLKVIDDYSQNNNFVFYKNLDRKVFISLYKNSQFIIGNSSSGICEAASLKIPAINVGLRQKGRFADENVIFCSTERSSIEKSIATALSTEFLQKIKYVKNSYGDGRSAKKAYHLIKTINFSSLQLKPEDPLDMGCRL